MAQLTNQQFVEIVLCIFVAPLAIFLHADKTIDNHFWISLVLYIICWVPSILIFWIPYILFGFWVLWLGCILHALWYCFKR